MFASIRNVNAIQREYYILMQKEKSTIAKYFESIMAYLKLKYQMDSNLQLSWIRDQKFQISTNFYSESIVRLGKFSSFLLNSLFEEFFI